MVSTVRRSGRPRQANKKYQNDLREKETLRLLRESSESSRPTSPDTSDPGETELDDDFDTAKVDEAQTSETEEDDVSLASVSGRGISEDSGIQPPNESDGNLSIATSGVSGPDDYVRRRRAAGPSSAQRVKADAHSRGLQPVGRSASKEVLWSSLAGSGDQDVLALLTARNHWKWRRDATFPSRKSLAETAQLGLYGNVSRFGISADDLKDEATAGWRWYNEAIGGSFRRRQRLKNIDGCQAGKHIAFATKHDSRIVMGPANNQQAYHLAHLAAMDFGLAWEKGNCVREEPARDANTGASDGEDSDKIQPESVPSAPGSRYREGWLLNLGSKIQCLAWAPNRHGDHTQYLAISTACSSTQRRSVPASNDKRAPAFRPSPSYPSSVQIWALRCAPASEGLQRLDMATQPKLLQVLCTHWGNIRQLQWCPVLRTKLREPAEQPMEDCNADNLGLLGVLASDGRARILDISVPGHLETGPQYLYVDSAAFDAASSSSLYTCLSFASPTDLLCGTASGSVDLFNILSNDQEAATQAPSSPTPYLTTQQSLTYIFTLSPAYPSPSPNLLASISLNGNPILTDLLSPATEKVVGKTARIASKQLVYSPHLRSYLSSEGDDVSASPFRRFYNGIRVARCTGHGTVSALATSRWHPCLLIGTTSGTVSGTNILRRVLPSIKRSGSSGAWGQKLCEYQWIPQQPPFPQAPKEDATYVNVESTTLPHDPETATNATATQNPQDPPAPSSSSSSSSLFYGRDTRPGTSRFHEGFRAEKQDLSATGKRKAGVGPGAASQMGSETIYEEEQAVTAAEWNPNIECAGWIAVGWGSGIVRVEDVGHEAV